MIEKRKVYVIGAKKVGPFTNRETGEIIEGTQVFYFDDKNPAGDFGHTPTKKFLKPEESHQVKNGTGYYNMLLEIDINGSRPRINVTGFEFLQKADLVIKGS